VIRHGILPAVVLSVNNTAVFVRYIRSNVIVQKEEDYVMTAISKGIPPIQVLRRHILKNCLLPIITMVGMNFGTLITGSFVVESVFGWPGLGTLCMSAINSRDYTMIMGITMLSCTVLLIGNFLADLLYVFADPRIKHGKEAANG
jgi:peptide/nickel transport system permease protein